MLVQTVTARGLDTKALLLLVQPGIQYLVNPGGNKVVPNALVVGVNVVLNY